MRGIIAVTASAGLLVLFSIPVRADTMETTAFPAAAYSDTHAQVRTHFGNESGALDFSGNVSMDDLEEVSRWSGSEARRVRRGLRDFDDGGGSPQPGNGSGDPPSPVPEPETFALMGAGLALLIGARGMKRLLHPADPGQG